MSDRIPHLPRAVVAVRRIANGCELQLTDDHCTRLARAAIEAIPTKAWYVGITKDQQEQRAAAGLREQGYVVYLPKMFVRHQDGRKIEAKAYLRFTGYIFIAFDVAREEHGPINNTPGMDGAEGSALICYGSGEGRLPLALPPGIIETLRQIEDEDLARAVARKKPMPRKDLTAGDMVMIAGDRTHPAFGRRGAYLGTDKFEARVLEGWAVWRVPEVDLKKIDIAEGKAA